MRKLMFTALVGSLLLCFADHGLWAQSHIEGTYDARYRTFFPHVNLLNQGRNPVYRVETFVHGYGVVENNAQFKGVIDSTGKVLVPLEYSALESCSSQRGYFIFYRDGKTGLVSINGIEQCAIKTEGRNDDKNRLVQTRIREMFYLFVNDKIGLFDAFRNRIIVPPVYDRTNFLDEDFERARRNHSYMYINDTLAIVHTLDSFFVHDLRSPSRSQPYSDVVMLSTGQLFLKSFNDFAAVSGDFMRPVNVLDFRVLDTYNDYILGRKLTGYGLTKADGSVVIPFVYEDIYFLNHHALWLKQNGRWAMANYAHEMRTPFEFEDVENSNAWFIHQLLEVSRLDTTGGNLYIEREYRGINDSPTALKTLVHQVQMLEGTKRMYNTILDYKRCSNWSAAKKSDGWHFIYPPLGTVEPESWEEVRYVPNCVDPYGMMAYRNKGMWGVDKEDVRYEGVLYDSMDLTMNCTCECIVKNGYVYSNSIDYTSNRKNNCYWDKQMKLEMYVVR